METESPTVIAMEAGDEVLQVLEICETVEEIKEVIVTTIEGNSNNTFSHPVVTSSGPGTKPSQVRPRGTQLINTFADSVEMMP